MALAMLGKRPASAVSAATAAAPASSEVDMSGSTAAHATGAPGGTAAVASKSIPWVERYRPRRMEDIASQEEIVRSLTASIRSGMIPHLLFYGPPGTGKTSTILAVARDMYGPELMKSRVLELNASDERGIGVVREKVKSFAQGSVGSGGGGGIYGPAPPFKLVILDEADSLTQDAQAALRRTMESYSKVTRFCIICNYVSRIIEPVASRCSKFRFKPLDTASMLLRLRTICDTESVSASDETLQEVLKQSNGDMRKGITFLQSCSALYGGVITPENVVEISGTLPPKDLDALVAAVKTGTYDAVRRHAQSITASGYGMAGVIEKLADALLNDAHVSERAKAAIAEKCALADKRLVDGADEELQLVDVVAAANRAIIDAPIAADKARIIIM